MELIAAIDLRGGEAVRLQQGDYQREAARRPDPIAVASAWLGKGVQQLHVVDLDGALAGEPRQLDLVAALVAAARRERPAARIELGGGLRNLASVAAALDTGVDEVVLGTAAVERPRFVAECATRWPGRIVVSLDLRHGRLALDGWLRSIGIDALELGRRCLADGASSLIVTDARRDGTLTGPNAPLLARFRAALPTARLVAAGGVGSTDHLRQMAELGIDGTIVGLALLSGAIDLHEALRASGPAA